MTQDVRLSKRLSRWLRHRPQEARLSLDAQGWADTQAVLAALQAAGLPSKVSALMAVVAANDKQRFEISEDGTRIRARQGHSVPVHLQWPAATPPALLYHGTVERFLADIMLQGLQPMQRHHVHLSPDVVTARQVGARRGKPVIVKVAAGDLAQTGVTFWRTANEVWLVEAVPPRFLEVLQASA